MTDAFRPIKAGEFAPPARLADESAQILERISDGFYALDRDWRFTYVNARFEALSGARREHLIGRTIWEAFPRLVDTAVHREHLRAVREARPVLYETCEAVMDRWIEGTVYPSETGLSVYLRDVTARKQAELMLRDREATPRSFYANAPVLMGVVELVGDDILHVYDNPATCRFFHRPVDGTAGRRASAMGMPPAAVREWLDHYRACEALGAPVHFEYEHAGPNGRCWLSVSVAMIGPGPSGRTRFCYVAEDVTGRKRAEAALRASEERFAAIFRQAAAGLVQTDFDGRIVLANDRYCAIVGRPRGAVLGLRIHDITHPDDLPRNLALLHRALEAGESFAIEKRYVRPDGIVVWVNNSVTAVRDADGRPQGLLAVTVDVTDRKRTEETLREREGRLEAALIASTTGTYRWDMQSRAQDWDSSLVRLFGRRPEEVANFLDCVHPDDRAAVAAATERSRRDGVDFAMDYRIIRPDGSVRWVVDKGKMIRGEDGTPLYLAGACTDITERKQAETHAARLAAIVESSEDAIIRQALDGTITAWNAGAERIYGYRTGEALGRSATLIAPPDRADEPLRLMARVCRGEEIRSFETIRRRKDGQDVPVSLSVSPIRDAQGRVVAVSTIARDVSDRRCMEEDLRRSEADYRTLFESAGVGNAETTADGRLLRVNRKFCEITGYTPEKLVGRYFADMTHPGDRAGSLAGLRSLRDRERDEFRMEKRFRREDGSSVWLNLTASAIRDAAGRLERCITVAEDITARKRAEAQQTLLTAELSHRVKNTLAVVQAIASQTLRRAKSPESFAESFGGRLHALASAHGLLTRSGWHPANLETALRLAVRAHAIGPGTVDIRGPDLDLAPKQILTLSLVLHELATNAAKYGALSTAAGRASVRWALEGAPDRRHLRLAWIERNGPTVASPAARGFGTKLIEESVAHELGGSATLAFDPAGVLCEIVIPWDRQPATGAARTPPASGEAMH